MEHSGWCITWAACSLDKLQPACFNRRVKLNYEQRAIFSRIGQRGGKAKLKKHGREAFREMAYKRWKNKAKLSTGRDLTKQTASIE